MYPTQLLLGAETAVSLVHVAAQYRLQRFVGTQRRRGLWQMQVKETDREIPLETVVKSR